MAWIILLVICMQVLKGYWCMLPLVHSWTCVRPDQVPPLPPPPQDGPALPATRRALGATYATYSSPDTLTPPDTLMAL